MVCPLNFEEHEGKDTNIALRVPCPAPKKVREGGRCMLASCNASHSHQEPSYGGKGIHVDTGMKYQGAR
jgi:hypothetical protein